MSLVEITNRFRKSRHKKNRISSKEESFKVEARIRSSAQIRQNESWVNYFNPVSVKVLFDDLDLLFCFAQKRRKKKNLLSEGDIVVVWISLVVLREMADAGLLAEIQKGKKLKKAVVNDRSAPQVTVGKGGVGGSAVGGSAGGPPRGGASAMLPAVPNSGGGMMGEMQRKLQARQNGESIKTSVNNNPSAQKPAISIPPQSKPANTTFKPPTPANTTFKPPPSSNTGMKPPSSTGLKQAIPSSGTLNKPQISTVNKAPVSKSVASSPPAVATKPALKRDAVDLSKYHKLQKAGLPQGAIEHAM